VNGSIALLVSEVQNALIDNAEGSYKTGIPLIAEAPHIPLQGEALPIPNAGGNPFGPTIDWAQQQQLGFGAGNYAQFIAPAQTADLTITNAPSTFTLDTQHFGTKSVTINSGHENLFTLIVGDSTAGESLGLVAAAYPTVEIVVAKGSGTDSIGEIDAGSNLVFSGSGSLRLGDVHAETITDNGVSLELRPIGAHKIDASNAPVLVMDSPTFSVPAVGGVTVLGGETGNFLQGSFDAPESTVTFSDGSTGLSFSAVGADNITGGRDGNDFILGDGGPDTITLPNSVFPDIVVFGAVRLQGTDFVLAITDGSDVAYPGSWGAGATKTAIPVLFSGSTTGGTSADMTVITSFDAGFPVVDESLGDELAFKAAAWNGSSAGFADPKGDLVTLDGGLDVQPGFAQLSAVWVNSASNSSLKASDNVLRYDPSDASVQNAQQLAAQLHTASDAITLPGHIAPGHDEHILVAYDARASIKDPFVVNIADVDLVNTSASNQSSTANLHVYASDMVSLTGVSLTDLTPANILFI
jgi:hypothetical protein